jgi:hypothetical protein
MLLTPTARKRLKRVISVIRRPIKVILSQITPARKTAVLLITGGFVLVYGISTWSFTWAAVIMGAELIVYSLLFIDVDTSATDQRRRRF